MAGNTPHAAFYNFLHPLQRALTCVSRDVIDHGGGAYPVSLPKVLTLGKARPVVLKRPSRLHLSVLMQYRLVEAEGERGPWKVRTTAYFYEIDAADGREILSYHWHPEGRSSTVGPHLHLGAGAEVGRTDLAQCHFPTGRIGLEEVLRLVITSFGVEPLRGDWGDVLANPGFS